MRFQNRLVVAVAFWMHTSSIAFADSEQKNAARPDDSGWKELARVLAIPVVVTKDQDLQRLLTLTYPPTWEIYFNSNTADYPQGVFRMSNLHCFIIKTTPLSAALLGNSHIKMVNTRSVLPDEKQIVSRAEAFLKEAFPSVIQSGPLPTPLVKEPASAGESFGVWRVRWKQFGGDKVANAEIEVSVRALDGVIVGFSTGRWSGEWNVKVFDEEAYQKVMELAGKDLSVEQANVTDWRRGGMGDLRVYIFTLRGVNRKSRQKMLGQVSVDALSGAISPIKWVPQREMQEVEDRWPVWNMKGLYFVSNRTFARMPNWIGVRPQLMLLTPFKKISYLTMDLEAAPSVVESHPQGTVLSLFRYGWTYTFNLNTGTYRVLGMPERAGDTPAVDAAGKWAVVSGKGVTATAIWI